MAKKGEEGERDSRNEIANNGIGGVGEREGVGGRSDLHASVRGKEARLNRESGVESRVHALVAEGGVQDVNVKGRPAKMKSSISLKSMRERISRFPHSFQTSEETTKLNSANEQLHPQHWIGNALWSL